MVGALAKFMRRAWTNFVVVEGLRLEAGNDSLCMSCSE